MENFAIPASREGFNMIYSMKNWYFCLSPNGFVYPKMTIWMGKMMINHQILGNTLFSDKPNSDLKICSMSPSKKWTKKNEEKRILCCTLNSRSCWMSLLHSSNRIRPAVQIIAPLRALCVALLYVLPDETKSLKSSNIINLPLWLIRGFGNFKRTPPKKNGAEPVFPLEVWKIAMTCG